MPSRSGAKSGVALQFAKASSRRPKQRKFYIVSGKKAISRASGFELHNEEALFQGRLPIFVNSPGPRGFRDYPEVPLFIADKRRGRIHWDLEEFANCWFISDRMKMVLEGFDPGAFAFLKCKVQLPGGSDAPARWLCDVVRVLDALDEERSEANAKWYGKKLVRVATDGSKYYSAVGREALFFKESAVRSCHIFRMKYSLHSIICDEEMRQACKSAQLQGISFSVTATAYDAQVVAQNEVA